MSFSSLGKIETAFPRESGEISIKLKLMAKLGGKRERDKNNKGRMGIPKQKWTSDEEDALLAGVAKHGAGKWRHILSDPDFAPTLAHRSNVDLKDKWRNMYAQRTYERPNNPKTKNSVRGTLPLLSIPNTVTPEAVVVENQERYTTLIFEALSGVSAMKDPSGSDVGAIRDYIQQKNGKPIPQNFKKLLGARLRSLVKLGKLEKTQNGFKIKRVTPSSVKAPSWLKTSTEIDEEDVRNAAYTVAEAKNKSFLADEAVKETERISSIAEDAESLLLAVEEINEQCSRGEVIHLS